MSPELLDAFFALEDTLKKRPRSWRENAAAKCRPSTSTLRPRFHPETSNHTRADKTA